MADGQSDPTLQLRSVVDRARQTGVLVELMAATDLLTQSDDMRDVVMALALLRGTDAVDAGLGAGLAARGLVGRQAAFTMLVEHLGLTMHLDPPQSPLGRLDTALVSPLPSVWEPAAAALRDIAVAVDGGSAPADLDLVYAPGEDGTALGAFTASLAHRDRPVDVDAIRRLTGHDRAWAETYIMARIGFGDPRAVDACAAFPFVRAVPVLLEAGIAHASDAPFIEHLDAAFNAIGGPAMLDVLGM